MIDQKSVPASVIDPVCGMSVNPVASWEYQGTTYSFCSLDCAEKFRADPARYLKSRTSTSSQVTRAEPKGQVEYTCPMHPQIVRFKPGPCPICGMALEPRRVTVRVIRTDEDLMIARSVCSLLETDALKKKD